MRTDRIVATKRPARPGPGARGRAAHYAGDFADEPTGVLSEAPDSIVATKGALRFEIRSRADLPPILYLTRSWRSPEGVKHSRLYVGTPDSIAQKLTELKGPAPRVPELLPLRGPSRREKPSRRGGRGTSRKREDS